MGDAAWEVYWQSLLRGDPPEARRHALRMSILAGMSNRFFEAFEPGYHRIGLRRWWFN